MKSVLISGSYESMSIEFQVRKLIIGCCPSKIWNNFTKYLYNNADLEINLKKKETMVLGDRVEDWKVAVVDAGKLTMIGGIIKRISKYIGSETFLLTYGDGLSDINLKELICSHKSAHAYATVTAVQPKRRFDSLEINESGRVAKISRETSGGRVLGKWWILCYGTQYI